VLLSAVGTFAMFALRPRGRWSLQAVVTALIFFVTLCFILELALARPTWHEALAGLALSERP
jgi:manganese transport protein